MSHCHIRSIFPLLALLLCCIAQPALARDNAPAKEGILLVAFGTSVPEARAAFDAIDAAYKKAFPGLPVVWAYTSQIIRKKLADQGHPVGSIGDGLAALARDGVKIARVQSLHMMAGEEFAALARSLLVNIQRHPGRFDAVYLGRPLLESRRDGEEAAQCVIASLQKLRKPDEAIALMGHGHEHGRADLVFDGARAAFRRADPHAYMATVEGSGGFDELAAELKQNGVKKALLAPLMIVAGDHARNDLAGAEDDSWASQLKKEGIAARACLRGLGEMPCIAEIFVRHTRESTDNLCREPVKP